MSHPTAPSAPDAASDDVMGNGVFRAVLEGYDAVYDALPRGETFNRLWRMNAYHGDFPEPFAHIGFLTVEEAQRLHGLLHIRPGEVLVDLACGAGGPGLWMARESGASLIGIDPSAAGLAAARQRATGVGLAGRARFQHGTFEQTNLADAAAAAVISIDAFQYAPGKRAAFAEFARIMRPGARVGIVCFEVDPAKAEGLPILGVDPAADYRPLIAAGCRRRRSRGYCCCPSRPSPSGSCGRSGRSATRASGCACPIRANGRRAWRRCCASSTSPSPRDTRHTAPAPSFVTTCARRRYGSPGGCTSCCRMRPRSPGCLPSSCSPAPI